MYTGVPVRRERCLLAGASCAQPKSMAFSQGPGAGRQPRFSWFSGAGSFSASRKLAGLMSPAGESLLPGYRLKKAQLGTGTKCEVVGTTIKQ